MSKYRLRFKAHKFFCKPCYRYFNQLFPGILKHKRATEKLRQQVFREHIQGVSQTDLAKQFFIGKSTIERWLHAHYHLQNQHRLNQHWPRVLGIDEHFFSKRQRFATQEFSANTKMLRISRNTHKSQNEFFVLS